MEIKSPFYIIEEFLSPLECEHAIEGEQLFVPNKDANLKDIPLIRNSNQANTDTIIGKVLEIVPALEQYYGFEYKGLRQPKLEWYPAETTSDLDSGHATFMQGKWVRTGIEDFTGVVFLKDYQDSVPIDEDIECYGGKLEMPNHQFSFNPKRGMLVVFPADMRFLNQTSTVYVGEQIQFRFRIVAESPWVYQPSNFPGNFQNWF